MNYPYKSITDTGMNLLASTVGQSNNNLVIDKVILSDKPISNSNDLHLITFNDFHNPFTADVKTLQHYGNTLQPNATIHSTNFKQDYPIYMIGLLAHTTHNKSEIVYSVAMAKDQPFIMPGKSTDELDFTISIPTSFANANDVKVITIDDDYNKLMQYEQKTDQTLTMIIKNMKANQLKGMKLGEIKD